LLASLPASASAQAVGAQPGADVSVVFTALGRDGKAVRDIKVDDLKLSADGAPVQPSGLKRQEDGPVFFTVAIDTSASQEKLLPSTKTVAGLFLKSMLRPAQDRGAVVTFADELTVEQAMTGDLNKLLEGVERARFVPPPGYVGNGIMIGNPPPRGAVNKTGTTGMWDAVAQIADRLMPRSLGAGRRVLLLITDGYDTSSSVKSNKAVAAALESGVVVYTIGIGDERFDGVDKNSLRKVAERTGGRAFFPKKVADVTESFKQISEGLSSQYLITFAPAGAARDGSFHKLKIEVVNRGLREQGVELAYPQEYYSGGAPTAPKQ
jgi:VWFA-related protein